MSSLFHSLLRNDSALKPKRWLWVAHDQLHSQLNPWAGEPPEETGLIFVESKQRGNVRPYHRQKLAFLLSNLRHRSLEAQQEGHPVRYLISEDDYGKALTDLAQDLDHLLVLPGQNVRQMVEVENLQARVLVGFQLFHQHRR